jgi:hypothetical protein
MIPCPNKKREKFQKIEAPPHSNLQVREIHYNKTLKMQQLNSFKIVLRGRVKSSKKKL